MKEKSWNYLVGLMKMASINHYPFACEAGFPSDCGRYASSPRFGRFYIQVEKNGDIQHVRYASAEHMNLEDQPEMCQKKIGRWPGRCAVYTQREFRCHQHGSAPYDEPCHLASITEYCSGSSQ
jgi:hypothetical protein